VNDLTRDSDDTGMATEGLLDELYSGDEGGSTGTAAAGADLFDGGLEVIKVRADLAFGTCVFQAVTKGTLRLRCLVEKGAPGVKRGVGCCCAADQRKEKGTAKARRQGWGHFNVSG